ncbi:MAG TPA: hypothetical protein VEM13_10345 [Gemmatimonadales bacterium]|nr:hypothetical protein [Gemmatimonadales bacterium]
MTTDSSDRMKIVIYYAVWATVCAAAAGVAISLIHTWFFSYNPGKSWLVHTLVSDILTTALLAAGQGAVALVTGSLLAHWGRGLQGTVLLGLLIGAFDFAMNFVQMVFPKTEVGWVPDLLIVAAVTIVITALGSRSAPPSAVS